MKRTVKVLLSFVRLSVLDKIAFTRVVVNSLSANMLFPNPPVDLKQLTQYADDLRDRELDARTGGAVETAAMHLAEKILDSALKKEAQYVESLANNDEASILGAGFKASVSESAPSQIPLQPSNFAAKVMSDAGSVELSCDVVVDAKSYNYVVVKADQVNPITFNHSGIVVNPGAGGVHLISDTHHKVSFTGLDSGMRYQAMVFAIGSKGKGPVSGTLFFVTQ